MVFNVNEKYCFNSKNLNIPDYSPKLDNQLTRFPFDSETGKKCSSRGCVVGGVTFNYPGKLSSKYKNALINKSN